MMTDGVLLREENLIFRSVMHFFSQENDRLPVNDTNKFPPSIEKVCI